MKRFLRKHRLKWWGSGQAIVEYILLIVLCAAGILAVIPDLEDTVGNVYTNSEKTVVPDSPVSTDPVVYGHSYTVDYDANFGTGAPDRQIKEEDVDLTLSSQIPTRTGFDFYGWAMSYELADSHTIAYHPGDTYTDNLSITLYASWIEEGWTVTYIVNAPDGVSGSFADGSQQKQSSKYRDVNLQVIQETPTATDLTFLGWSESASATAAEYTAADYITENRDMTLYGVWQNAIFTVSYDANGGTGAVPDSARYSAGSSVTVGTASLTKTGYQFVKGWSETAGSSTIDYAAGESFEMPARDVTLYAVYMPTEFPYNGTDGSDGSVQTFTAPRDGTYVLQLWGAEGGSSYKTGTVYSNQGKGGYTLAAVELEKGETVYIAVGGKGADQSTNPSSVTTPGGWNGGGSGYNIVNDNGWGGGGGATSVQKLRLDMGTLADYISNQSDVIAVAGGGAGANSKNANAAAGGLTAGSRTYGAGGSTGYAFGQGQSGTGPVVIYR